MKKRWVKWVIRIGVVLVVVYFALAVRNYIRLRETWSAWNKAMSAPQTYSDAQKVEMWKWRFARADYDGKRALVEGVRITKDRTAIPALQECLKSDDIWLHIHASEALYAMGDHSAYEALVKLLDFRDINALAKARGHSVSKAPATPEQELGNQGELHAIRYLAARLLGNNKEERALPMLIKMFKEGPDPGLGEALATFQTQEIADLIFEQWKKRPFAMGYIKGMVKLKDERAIPMLERNFDAGITQRQKNNDPRSDAFHDGERKMRHAALALLAFDRTDHLDFLLEEIRSGKRRQTAYDIAETGYKEAREPFLDILSTTNDPMVVYALGLSLVQLGYQNDPRVVEALGDAVERFTDNKKKMAAWILFLYPQPEAQAIFTKHCPGNETEVGILKLRLQQEGFAALRQ